MMAAMRTVFESHFEKPDPRWRTRHTPTPDLPAGDFAPRYTADGRLVMRLRERDGVVHTTHLYVPDQEFVFGRFEARMRFASPRGAHSAFWLQDVEPDRVGGCEVDIVEHFGSDSTVQNNLHWRAADSAASSYNPEKWHQSIKVDPRGWHVYRLDWLPDRYVFRIDGREVARTTEGLSSMPKRMILSLLSSTWEHPALDRDRLDRYRSPVDWVRVQQ